MESISPSNNITHKEKKTRTTFNQLSMLVALVEQDRSLHTRAQHGPNPLQDHRRNWAAVAEQLNELGPAPSSWEQVWRNLLKRTRQKNSAIIKGKIQMGMGYPFPSHVKALTELERRVLRIVEISEEVPETDSTLEDGPGDDFMFPDVSVVACDSQDDVKPFHLHGVWPMNVTSPGVTQREGTKRGAPASPPVFSSEDGSASASTRQPSADDAETQSKRAKLNVDGVQESNQALWAIARGLEGIGAALEGGLTAVAAGLQAVAESISQIRSETSRERD